MTTKFAAIATILGLVFAGLAPTATAVVGPMGSGFTLTPADVAFILKQIKIAERHSRAFEGDASAAPQPNPNLSADPNYCLSMIGSAPDQIPDALTAYGLRTVDGSCNNLSAVLDTTTSVRGQAVTPTPTFANRPTFGASDQLFPRLTTPQFRTAEGAPAGFFGPHGPTVSSSTYASTTGLVFDTQPRLISNLIVDETSTNPAAVAAAGLPVRAQAAQQGVVPCNAHLDPATGLMVDDQPLAPDKCIPAHHTLPIPNITTDVGLSPPFNSLFTFFGQFFDHGVDQTVKGGGTVFVPLRADDPLITLGPDGVPNNGDEVPPNARFMVLTRAQNQPGADGILGTSDDLQEAANTDTPWVDNSQTYTSHASHQVFVREYALNSQNKPVSTGRLLGGLGAGQTYLNSPDGTTGISTWASVKRQAATVLGLLLVDTDVTNVPMLAVDPYGRFIPGPARGLPQYVTTHGLVEGDLANPVPVPADTLHFDTPFLTDIAHNADPSPQDTDNSPATPPVAPVPDADNTPSTDFAHQPAGTYDDEMLNAHFVCGDGRCNENIALSTIHQIFHTEHNRLVNDIENVLLHDTSATGVAALQEWKLPASVSPDGWNGERLFQAARYVNEMEYQHLVFEEFARKVQPLVRPFHVYSPDINPAIKAEFAHAVYRFGHSMLDEDVARTSTRADGSKVDNSLPLLTAFLNPPGFFDNSVDPASPVYTPEQAAGAVVMGSSDQVGNEIDEFVTETLRNNLVGLPLDLAALNLTRAREAGVPPLNEVRRQLYAATNDGQLQPYTDWSDFGQHLKHPESLINFVAAYGTHPSITDVSTIAAKRAAARAIVDPQAGDTPPADAADFMFGTGAWASDANGVTATGLDSVDLWVGGLAEITNLNGGLLGSTFNYVFQNQLENLQDGDRLYYLNRTPGTNLRSQLEGNSFSELIQRTTDGTNSLKADAFATADCKFNLAHLAGTPAGFAQFGPTVADDASTTDCDESLLLQRKSDGTIQYRSINSVNPPGINGQSVYQGSNGNDRIFGGNDNDTFWGGLGNDVIEGGGGDDIALGGEGNDIITDLDGADVLKGGPGNDAVDGGLGNDILMGGDGQDFLNGGANDNEEFAGPGNDFIIAGQGADAVFGDGGDDWIEGGSGQDLLQGDHGAPFFDDPAQTAPGNDVMVGQVGENDYDAEGGDDLMAQNAAIDRNAGAAGFDWAFHQYDTVPADDDMEINNNLVGLPIQVVVNRDRWQETEANSGDKFNDVIKGGSRIPATIGGAGFLGCDALDAAGVARIAGLDKLVTSFTDPLAPIVALSAAGACPLNNGSGTGNVWAKGDILLGGGGSDVLEGRGGDDIIDGDHRLHVRISVRTDPADPATETGWTDLMESKAIVGNFGPGTAGMTLQQAVFAGKVDPGHLVIVREIQSQNGSAMGATPDTGAASDCGPLGPLPTSVNCDVAVFGADPGAFTLRFNADGSITVSDAGGAAIDPLTGLPKGGAARVSDGTDTLWNIEDLRFCLATNVVTKQCTFYQDMVLAPHAQVFPSFYNFAAVPVGSTSGATNFAAFNTGTKSFTVTNVSLSGPDASVFTMTGSCGVVIPSESCFVTLTYTPTAVGAVHARLHFDTTDPFNPSFDIPLTGTGLALAPVIEVAPNPLVFFDQEVGVESVPFSISVHNTGTTPLSITGATLGGANAASFAMVNNCGATLAPGDSCPIDVTFNPTVAGDNTAHVVLTSNDPVNPSLTEDLSGVGIAPPPPPPPAAPAVPAAPPPPAAPAIATLGGPLAFGIQPLNVGAPVQQIVVTNPGAGSLVISGVGFAGPSAAAFSATTDCTVVAPGGNCVVHVTFVPGIAGAQAATLVIGNNAGGDIGVPVTGVGVPPTRATISRPFFGRVLLGRASSRTVIVRNTGRAPLIITNAWADGPYSVSLGTCAAPVARGRSCRMTVTFRPTSSGPSLSTLHIVSNATNNPVVVLTGTGR